MNHFLTSVDWSRTCPLQLLEKSGDLGGFIWFLSTLRDHEQSSSDEITSVRCVHRSPAHPIEQEDLLDILDLITALVKLNLFLSTALTMQCTFQSSP